MDKPPESSEPNVVSLMRYAPPPLPRNPTVEKLDEIKGVLDEILAELRGRPAPKAKRTRRAPVGERAKQYLIRKLDEAGPKRVEWKRLIVERKLEGDYSERTLRRARDVVGQARYADGTCYWVLKPSKEGTG